MSPVKLSFKTRSIDREVCAEDKIVAVIRTPIGKAFAQTRSLRLGLLTSIRGTRVPALNSQFPHETKPHNSEDARRGRKVVYSTEEGQVEITAKYIDKLT